MQRARVYKVGIFPRGSSKKDILYYVYFLGRYPKDVYELEEDGEVKSIEELGVCEVANGFLAGEK